MWIMRLQRLSGKLNFISFTASSCFCAFTNFFNSNFSARRLVNVRISVVEGSVAVMRSRVIVL